MARRNRKRKTAEQKADNRRRHIDRWLFRPVRLVAILLFGTAVGLGVFQLTKFMRTSPALAIRTIEVRGAKRAQEGSLLQTAGIAKGQNIFDLDLADARKRLRSHPWVRKAQVRRVVPDRIQVEVVEHVPVALVILDGIYLVSDQAELFKRVASSERFDLPVITGFGRERFKREPRRAGQELRMLLDVSERIQKLRCLSSKVLAELQTDPVMGVTAVFDPGAVTVRLGKRVESSRLTSLCQAFSELDRRALVARSILLDNEQRPNWATVRLETEKGKGNIR